MGKRGFSTTNVFFLDPKTCGIYKNGATRVKVDEHGKRTTVTDNELLDDVTAFIAGDRPPGMATIPVEHAINGVLVPRYFDPRWDEPFNALKASMGFDDMTIGALIDSGVLTVRGGHGSPGNDQRVGTVPYVKVSDIRNLRINVNPTNLIPPALARRFWRSDDDSGLRAWDVLTPNRASSNIGECAILLPGEDKIVLTKEVFVFRVTGGAGEGWDPFYLLWALSLAAVRRQWQRITLMQTNREDVGDRYREIRLPIPMSSEWATTVSGSFRTYFTTIGTAKEVFRMSIEADSFDYIASVFSSVGDPIPETPLESDINALEV